MDSFAYLYVALALVGAALASIAVWSRRRALWKAAAVGLLAALVVVGYFSYSMLLSRPKMLSPELDDVAGARVLSAALREDEAIYLWLSIEGTPRFYALPWDQAAAQRLQSVMRETRRSGHDVVIRSTEPGDDSASPRRRRRKSTRSTRCRRRSSCRRSGSTQSAGPQARCDRERRERQ